jgi:hypothetical protein
VGDGYEMATAQGRFFYKSRGGTGVTFPGSKPPSQPTPISQVPPPDTNRIPDSALPIAAGVTAAVAALGGLGVAFAQGIGIKDAIGELIGLFQGKTGTTPVESPTTTELPSEEVVAEAATEGVPSIGYEKDGYVWSHRPGDLAGDGWLPKEDYENIIRMEGDGRIWSQRWGWTTPEEAKQYEMQHTKAVNKYNKETSKILNDLTNKEYQTEKLQAEIAKIEQDIDSSANLAGVSLQFAAETKQMAKDGYWVRNPYNSKIIDKANMLISPLDEKGVRCQDLVELKEDHVRQLVKQKFGDGAIVDQVVVDEKSSVSGQGIRDSLDAVLEYNHTAIRVITPDGKAYIVDYWQALHDKGTGTGLIMRTEENWAASWKRDIGAGDFVFLTQGKTRTEGAEESVARLIEKLGPDQGIKKWQESQIQSIKLSNLGDSQKEVQIKEVETFVNYFNRRGQKLGY